MIINRNSVKQPWPFTVDSGELLNIGGSVIFRVDATDYALTGFARGLGYPAIDPIWKKTSGMWRVSLSEVINKGLDL